MLRWVFVFGLLFLAACQQAPATGTAHSAAANSSSGYSDLPEDWSPSGNVKESKYFAAEQNDVSKRLAAGLFGGCYRYAGDNTAMDRCLRKGLIDAFDDSGQGRRNCKSLSALDAFTDCVVLGNAAVEMLRRMDSKVQIDPADWAGRRSLADVMGKVAVTSGIMACGDAKTESTADKCLFDWYQDKLAVPETLARKCNADLSPHDRGACLGEASIIRYMQDHVARLPGTSI